MMMMMMIIIIIKLIIIIIIIMPRPHDLFRSQYYNPEVIKRQKNNSSRAEIYEKNGRIHLDRLQIKYPDCKGIKNNTNSGHITGIQEKLDATCK